MYRGEGHCRPRPPQGSDRKVADRPEDSSIPGPEEGPLSGRRLGEFELREPIGRGGMGVVYRAWQVPLNRMVAVKVLNPQVSASPHAVARFRREAQAAAKLHHRHIVPIFALGEEGGLYYYAMELVEGPSLHRIIVEARGRTGETGSDVDQEDDPTVRLTPGSDAAVTRPLHRGVRSSGTSAAAWTIPAGRPTEEAQFDQIAHQMACVADALAYAHDEGVIHRDIKPHNLLFGSDGHLRISDFGLARLTEQPGVTVTGEMIGSPLYMAPEQLRGESTGPDRRADIYALGATLYEWLALVPPYPGRTREQVISLILTSEAPPVRSHNPAVPPALELICMKAIERDLRRRYSSAAEMRDDLRRYLDKRPVRARRASWPQRVRRFTRRHQIGVVAAAAAAIALVLIGMLVSKERQVRSREAAVAQVQEENRRLRDLLMSLPLEVGGPLRLAEAAAPVLEEVVGGAGKAAVPKPSGADPSAVSNPRAVARRMARDLYTAFVPNGWPEEETTLPPLLADALQHGFDDPQAAATSLESYRRTAGPQADRYPVERLLTALYGVLGDGEAMLAAAERLQKLQPERAESYLWRGLARLLAGKTEAALADARRSLELASDPVWVFALQGLIRFDKEEYVDALASFNAALDAQPHHVIALLGRASIRAQLGNADGAIADLTAVLEMEPDNADVLAFRGDQYVALEDYAAAERDFAEAIRLAGRNAPMLIRYLGAVTRRRGALPDATSEKSSSQEVRHPSDAPAGSRSPSAPADSLTDWVKRLFRAKPSRDGLGGARRSGWRLPPLRISGD
ncbi:MAG: serine/threonine-protein kinase [Planctomycetota bacterium]|nr:MAG: serine/threonine-protein kinase [Planctomycetota bacterium]